jgi:hypothetical protein
VPELSAFELEMVTEKLKRHKSPGTDRMTAEFIKQWVEEFADICKLIYSVWNKEDLTEQWKQ